MNAPEYASDRDYYSWLNGPEERPEEGFGCPFCYMAVGSECSCQAGEDVAPKRFVPSAEEAPF